MPLLKRPSEQAQYSKSKKVLRSDLPSDEDLFSWLTTPDHEPEATADEIIDALTDVDDTTITPAKWSKNVQRARSKNVSARRRRSTSLDARILQRISAFEPYPNPAVMAPSSVSSLVGHPTPLHTHPLSPLPVATSTTPANDNSIPVWAHTGDHAKAVFAVGALLIAETPAVAFTFNLTPEAQEIAKGLSGAALDSLKRSLDLELKRAFGIAFPYFFALDLDDDGRLHIHGAFLSPVMSLRRLREIRKVMKRAWGEWKGSGLRKQLRFKTLYSDGWADYCMRNQRQTAKIVGKRVLTINQPLRRDAQRVYNSVREIMRHRKSQ